MSSQAEQDELPVLRVLVPTGWSLSDLDGFTGSARTLATEPFEPGRVALMEEFSMRLLSEPGLRRESAAAALGFWLRPAHVRQLEADFRGHRPDYPRVPVGLVFHVAPANVDTMFVYSWALSFLCGNANLVRLTTRRSALVDDLLGCLASLFESHAGAARGNVFITYGHDATATARFSAVCDCRIVWGGDETVRRLRAVPLNPHSSERSFASKRSLSVIVSSAYFAATPVDRDRLAARMAADVAPFGQMACSSPHVIYWIGAETQGREAIRDFAVRLQDALQAKLGAPDLGWAVRRITFAFDLAASGTVAELKQFAHSASLTASDAAVAQSKDPCGAGLLTNAIVPSLDAIPPLLDAESQTITYFGLSPANRERLALLAGRAGADRIVPAGRALEFGPYWDGYCLWDDLTRIVVAD